MSVILYVAMSIVWLVAGCKNANRERRYVAAVDLMFAIAFSFIGGAIFSLDYLIAK